LIAPALEAVSAMVVTSTGAFITILHHVVQIDVQAPADWLSPCATLRTRYRISNTSYTTLSARLSPMPIETILLIQEYFGAEVSKNGAVRR
jgi:hypothetical protein